ncbi:class I SAM-dependent methyltransferase [Candidatus Peregrinibacteria bacterium]|nr:class I SAM-dependent methyltransferase [Candidatus Peregrinibacteria bacterium]
MKDKIAKELLAKVVNDYNEIAEEFDSTRNHSWKEFKIFLKYIKNGQKIADLGCGNGRFYDFLKENCKINYTGIDNSTKLLNLAKSKFKNDSDCQFLEGDLLKTGLETNSQDLVTAIASFHHLPGKETRKKSLQEIHRILKENGILIISVWNLFQEKYKKYIWKARLKHIVSLGKYDWRDTMIPWGKSGVKRYYYAFKVKELQQLLGNNGFKVLGAITDNNFVFICQKK